MLEVGRGGILYAPWARRYRLSQFDDRIRECPRCGRHDVLGYYPGYVVVCQDCFKRRWARADELARSGRARPFTAATGEVRCMECGRWNLTLLLVTPGRLCLYCMWHWLGRTPRRLKVDGVSW